jgi:hypothetical protein
MAKYTVWLNNGDKKTLDADHCEVKDSGCLFLYGPPESVAKYTTKRERLAIFAPGSWIYVSLLTKAEELENA